MTKRHRRQVVTGNAELAELRALVRQQADNLALLQEADAATRQMLALEDVGWQRLGDGTLTDLNRADLTVVIARSRLMYLRDPLINRAVNIQAHYVWAQGVGVQATDPKVNEVMQGFLDDPDNRAELTGHQARTLKEIDLAVLGNLFFTFFVEPSGGAVRVRTIPVDQIDDVVCNPEDRRQPWWYHRVWAEQTVDGGIRQREAYYPDWRKPADAVQPTHGEVLDVPVYHVKVGGLSDMKFGLPETYQALDWAKAYKEFLEDRATIARALSRFVFKLTTPGGKAGIAAAKEKLGTKLGTSTAETNPAPTVGAGFIRSTAGADIDTVKVAGATINPEEGRRFLLQVAAAMGLPECYAEGTEVLTDKGFMSHEMAWREGVRVACFNPDSSLIEWHQPRDLRSYYYNGQMIHFRNQQTDILVTPNHRMWTSPNVQWQLLPATGKVVCAAYGKGGRQRVADGAPPAVDRSWRIELAEHLASNPRDAGWRFTTELQWQEPHSTEEIDTPIGRVSAIEWARFVGYWVAEGCATSSICKSGEFRKDGTPIMRTFRRIMLAQREGPVLERMKLVLTALGLRYTTVVANAGVINLVIYHKLLWSYLRDAGGYDSLTRCLPHNLLFGDEAVRRALFNALIEGDGGRSGSSWRYSTASKQLADEMQILSVSLGYGASVTKEERLYKGEAHPIYRVWIRTRVTETSCLRPQHVQRVRYSGMVNCFAVPTGIYVTRRNGKIAIQGNTFLGDVSVGTLATAKSLDRPTELKFAERQVLWRDVYLAIIQFVLDEAVKAGTLAEASDRHVDVTFPSILERDVGAQVNAIVSAATLDGKEPVGTVDDRTLVRLLLTALGVDQIDEILDAVAPDNGESLLQQRRAQKSALAQAINNQQGEPDKGQGSEQPAAEALMVEAVAELRAALREVRA